MHIRGPIRTRTRVQSFGMRMRRPLGLQPTRSVTVILYPYMLTRPLMNCTQIERLIFETVHSARTVWCSINSPTSNDFPNRLTTRLVAIFTYVNEQCIVIVDGVAGIWYFYS